MKKTILGIDPGIATLGYGVLLAEGGRFSAVDYGVVTTPKGTPLPERLEKLEEGVVALFDRFTPDEVANHPRNNVITRSLSATFGYEEPTMATVIHINDLQAGDYFFLCTDGVLDGLTDSTLLAILSTPLPDEEKLGHLADRCLKSHDNHTAYLIPIASVEYNTALKATNETGTSFRQDGGNTDKFNRKSQQVHEVAIRTNKPRNRMVAFIRKHLFL